jgi:hypothetical protein
MRKFNFRMFKALSFILILLAISITSCKKENETKSMDETIQTYVYQGTEYHVKMVKTGEEFDLVENETTKMLANIMEMPTSGLHIDQKTGIIYLFGTYEEADAFFDKIKEANKLKINNLKSYTNSCAEYYTVANGWNTQNLITSISGCYFPENYSNEEYNYRVLSTYGCNDAIASICMHGGINGIGLYVTLCEHTQFDGRRCYLYVGPGDNSCVNLKDYIMIKRLFRNTNWDYQASSMYINI